MTRRWRRLALPLLLTLSLITGGWAAPAQPAPADWTVLLYFAGDNNLEGAMIGNGRQIANVGSTPKVNIILQFDRGRDETDDDLLNVPNWSGAKRLRAERDSFTELQDLGQVDMSSPRTLSDFIQWGKRTYPAKRYALVLNDHGSAWLGCCEDDSTGKDAYMSLDSIATGLRDGGVVFDLLAFDACLMASLEVAMTVRPYATAMLASMEVTFGTNFDYEGMLTQMQTQPAADGLAIARTMADGYMRRAQAVSPQKTAYNTFSVVDLTRVQAVEESFAAFVNDVDRYVTGAPGSTDADRLVRLGQVFARARAATPAFWQETYKDPGMAFDLGDLAQNAGKITGDVNLLRSAVELTISLKGAVPYVVAGERHAEAGLTGLSVFVPYAPYITAKLYKKYSALPKLATTKWVALIGRYIDARATDRTLPVVSAPTADRSRIAAGQSARIRADVSDETMLTEVAVSTVSFVGGQPMLLARDPQPIDYGATAAVDYAFDGQGWYLDDGSGAAPQPVMTTLWRPGQRAVFGRYAANQRNPASRSLFIFDEASGQLLEGYQQVDYLAGAIRLRTGARFEPSLYTPSLTPIATRAVAIESATLRRLPLPPGEYQVSVTGVDIGGNFKSAGVAVSVGRTTDVAPGCEPAEGDALGRAGTHPLRFQLPADGTRAIPLHLDRNRVAGVTASIEEYGESYVYADPDDPDGGTETTVNYAEPEDGVFAQVVAPDGRPVTPRAPVETTGGGRFAPALTGAYQLRLTNKTKTARTIFVTFIVAPKAGVQPPETADLAADPAAAAQLARPGLHGGALTVPAGRDASVTLNLDPATTPQFGYSFAPSAGARGSVAFTVVGPDGKTVETAATCGQHAGGFRVERAGAFVLRFDNAAGGADVPLTLWLEGYTP